MQNRILIAVLLAAGALLVANRKPTVVVNPVQPAPAIAPAPVTPDCPDGKCPVPAPSKPRPWVRPWRSSVEEHGAFVGGPLHAGGALVQCPLPGAYQKKNIDSPAGSNIGCCVFRSIEHADKWQSLDVFTGFAEWLRTKRYTGGGSPLNVPPRIKEFCKEKGVPEPRWLQVEDTPERVLPLLRAAADSGRMPIVTYRYSPTKRYGGGTISHMVNLAGAGVGEGPDGKGWWVVLDNNYTGEAALEWMSEAEYSSVGSFSGKIWAVILLGPGAPPSPWN